jgi:DnaJ-class molecular chaperone
MSSITINIGNLVDAVSCYDHRKGNGRRYRENTCRTCDGRTFTTRQEAEGAMKTVKVCESGGAVGGPVPVPR